MNSAHSNATSLFQKAFLLDSEKFPPSRNSSNCLLIAESPEEVNIYFEGYATHWNSVILENFDSNRVCQEISRLLRNYEAYCLFHKSHSLRLKTSQVNPIQTFTSVSFILIHSQFFLLFRLSWQNYVHLISHIRFTCPTNLTILRFNSFLKKSLICTVTNVRADSQEWGFDSRLQKEDFSLSKISRTMLGQSSFFFIGLQGLDLNT